MSDDGVRVDGIDHVELAVPDRYEAAEWYGDVLGFEIVDEFEDWAELGAYPLMISSDGGDTTLALFRGTPSDGRGGFRRVAFRTAGEEFLAFLDRLDSVPAVDATGARNVSDFGSAYSVFFSDPHGYPLEVTTYDYDVVSDELASR
ncbi:hypothetical protein BRC63_09800 [Halobacteriales archaeon QH_10_70_21]|nr:MAG: hypothetical protein BRC63_09800 [Halobacteriales archaeon QH_10_70_21]